MQISPMGATFTRTEEGFVGHWYADTAGVGSIGCGFTWQSSAFRSWWSANRPGQTFGPGVTMTREEADAVLVLLFDAEYGAAVNKFFGVKAPAQNVFDGYADVCFNLGPGSLGWKWAIAGRSGDLAGCVAYLETTGTQDKAGHHLTGLVNRRKEEGQLIEFGDYTIGDVTQVLSTNTVLVKGEHGSAIVDLQKTLTKLGLYKGVIDGRFGYGTEAAVLAFQRAHTLTVDGKVGPETQAALLKGN